MSVLASFLVFGALYARSLADHDQHCDKFHVQSYFFDGKTGQSIIQLGLLETEHKAGELAVSIDSCDSCEIKSKWPNAATEGREGTGDTLEKYRIALTQKGLKEISTLTSRSGRRRVPGQGSFSVRVPFQNHAILRLAIDSGVVDGLPTVPHITEISFGGVVKCKPRHPLTQGKICQRRSSCPDSITEYKPGGFDLTIPANERRSYFVLRLEFTTDVDGLKVTDTPKDIHHVHLEQKCKSYYAIKVFRSKQRKEDEIKLSFNFTSDEAPVIQFLSTQSRKWSKRQCGYTCGESNPCPKPSPTTTSKPTLKVTKVKPEPEVTDNPEPEVTVKPKPEVTEKPEPGKSVDLNGVFDFDELW